MPFASHAHPLPSIATTERWNGEFTGLAVAGAVVDELYDVVVKVAGGSSADCKPLCSPHRIRVTSRVGSVAVERDDSWVPASLLPEKIRVAVGSLLTVNCKAMHESSSPMGDVLLEIRLIPTVSLGSLIEDNIPNVELVGSTAKNLSAPRTGIAMFSSVVAFQTSALGIYRVQCRAPQFGVESALSDFVVVVENPVTSVRVDIEPGPADGDTAIFVPKFDAAETHNSQEPKVCANGAAMAGLAVSARAFRVDDNDIDSVDASKYGSTDELALVWEQPSVTSGNGCAVLKRFRPTTGLSGKYAFVFGIAGIESNVSDAIVVRVINENIPDSSQLEDFKLLVVLLAPITLPFFCANSLLVASGVSAVAAGLSVVAETVLIAVTIVGFAGPVSRGVADDPFFTTVLIIMGIVVLFTLVPFISVTCACIARRRRFTRGDPVAGAHSWQGYDYERKLESAIEHTRFVFQFRPMRDTEGRVATPKLKVNLNDSWIKRTLTRIKIKTSKPPRTNAFLERPESVWLPTRLLASAALAALATAFSVLVIMLLAEYINTQLGVAFDRARNSALVAALNKARSSPAFQSAAQTAKSEVADTYPAFNGIADLALELNVPFFGVDTLHTIQSHISSTAAWASAISVIIMALTWYYQLSHYRVRIFRFRHGNYGSWVREKPGAAPASAYIASSAVQSVLGFLLIAILTWIILLILSYAPLRKFLWDKLGSFLAISFILSLGQTLLIIAVGQTLTDGFRLRHPRWHSLFDFVVTFVALAGVVGKGISRTIMAIVIVPVTVVRIDVPFTAFRALGILDAAFKSYKAMTIVDAQLSNPILLTFVQACREATRVSHEGKVDDTADRKAARARWHLALLLVRNPSLVHYRRRPAPGVYIPSMVQWKGADEISDENSNSDSDDIEMKVQDANLNTDSASDGVWTVTQLRH